MKARWRSSSHPGMICVFVELSLAEMLRQQQSEACLYHGQEISKKWAEYFFHGKCAFVLTLQHPRLRYAREFHFWSQLFKGRFIITRNPGSFYFFQKHFLGEFSLIFIEHRIINFLTKKSVYICFQTETLQQTTHYMYRRILLKVILTLDGLETSWVRVSLNSIQNNMFIKA